MKGNNSNNKENKIKENQKEIKKSSKKTYAKNVNKNKEEKKLKEKQDNDNKKENNTEVTESKNNDKEINREENNKKNKKEIIQDNNKIVSKNKGKKKYIVTIIVLSILLFFILLFILYCFVIPFNASISIEGDTKTTTGELSFNVKVNANKSIVNTYYAIDPFDENDKSYYEKISSSGSSHSKRIEFENLQIPVGKRKICIYVESFLSTKDVVCEELEFDLGYINKFNNKEVINIDDNTRVVKNELLIIFNDEAKEEDIDKLIDRFNGEVVGRIYYNKMYQVKFKINNSQELTHLIEVFEQENIVDAVSYNMVFKTSSSYTVNDEVYEDDDWNNNRPSGKNWDLEVIEAREAWDLIKNPKRINVGVIDNPINNYHEDLRLPENNIFYLPSNDFPTYNDIVKYINSHTNKNNEKMSNQHGTHVAGIIAALHNKVGIAGIGLNVNLFFSNSWRYDYDFWENTANIASPKSIGHDEDEASYIFALSNLIMSNCRIINMSLESSEYHEQEYYRNTSYYRQTVRFYDEIFKSFDDAGKDYIIVKSAGNEDKDAQGFMFNYIFRTSDYINPHLIIVGAIDKIDFSEEEEENTEVVYSRASFSNFGNCIDIFAPGVDIYSTLDNETEYGKMTGTSQAAPIVAGVAELIYSINPNLTYFDVKNIIENSGEKVLDNNGRTGYVVNAKNAVQAAIDYDGPISNEKKDKYGFVQGSIVDAKTDKPIDGNVSVSAKRVKGHKIFFANTTIGGYSIILPEGIYDISFTYSGYVRETIHNVVVTEGVVTYNVKLSMVDDKKEKGTVSGTVKDAIVRDKKVPNATMKFYKGINNTDDDDFILNVQSDDDGDYEVSLDPGNYTVVVSADNYITGKCYVVSIPGSKKKNQDCTISPVLNEGEIRAVLTWDYHPYDLDSHLLGPTPDGNRFHIFYYNKNYDFDGVNYDNLDVDDRNSYGPETISVYKNVNGEYLYLVHDYTNRHSTDSNSLGNSSAQIKLYVYGKTEPYIFNVPNKPGTVWKVFKISNGEVIPINEMSYESDPSMVGK